MGHIFQPLPLDWAILLPNPDCSLAGLCPLLVLETSLRHFTCFFLIDLGASFGDTRVCEDWSPNEKGHPIKAEQMDEAGEVDRGSGQDAFHRAAEVPPLSRKVEGLGTRMELWNTRVEAAPGRPWLAA